MSESARLPVGDVVLRMGWAQTDQPSEGIFTRAGNHPIDGAAIGTVSGTYPPPFPPSLNTSADLHLFIWIAADAASIADVILAGGGTLLSSFSNAAAYTLESFDGTIYISERRLSAGVSGYRISAVVGGALIASQPWVRTQITAQAGPAKLGNWTGNLVGDTWTATTIAWPTTTLVGVAAVHEVVFDNVTAVAWPIGWFDSTAVGALRYNFRLATAAGLVWIRKTTTGMFELRTTQNRDDLSFDFWSL